MNPTLRRWLVAGGGHTAFFLSCFVVGVVFFFPYDAVRTTIVAQFAMSQRAQVNWQE